ncbi:citrate lyase holo-[acyl-carrier protein] synthase [Vibrio hannami]|uniref:citrate lyase holo-[acyl-carrier protein] synthase n=1 Tax=Vibrio hannami TaxID=2717094 RepID=UPI00240EDE71|nr:citrate lyase holo-[acyl-carrier protein] synthase [Vibrio hannami]MDG3085614.1 citrate lyase holo-[acyl-carrier protein] synthase [Vibrio hannami]
MSEQVTVYDRHEGAQARAQRQQRWIAKHQLPLITLTTYMPKHMVHSTGAKKLFLSAMESTLSELNNLGCRVEKKEVFNQKSGSEAMFVVAGASPTQLKKAMIKLERRHFLGSLINLDVMNSEGKTISRKAYELEPRKCIVCNNAASYCSTANKHSAYEIESKVSALLESYYSQEEAVA